MAVKSVYNAGDVVWVNLSPTQGHEQRGTRPVVVISEGAFNAVSGLVTIVPVTSARKGFITEVEVTNLDVSGVALIDQIRTLDTSARRCAKKGKITDNQLAEIRAKIAAILGLK